MMLQLSIATLFALASIASVLVIAQAIRHAVGAAASLRHAIAACDTVQVAVVRTRVIERHARPAVRVIEGKKARLSRGAYALPAAA